MYINFLTLNFPWMFRGNMHVLNSIIPLKCYWIVSANIFFQDFFVFGLL